jgi:hypothetical protein
VREHRALARARGSQYVIDAKIFEEGEAKKRAERKAEK